MWNETVLASDKLEMPNMRYSQVVIFFCLAIQAFLFLALFSISTSPFYQTPYMDDSGIFQYIGENWTEGIVPYLELWDNKGPLLYFINALGFLICGCKYGIFILQVLNLTSALWVIYQTFRINYGSRVSVLGTTAALLWLSNMTVNNNPAEWLLIPLCLSFYLLYKWLKSYPQESLSWRSSLVFGITIGCGFLLRFSDCIPLIVALIVAALFLIYDGKWKDVIKHSMICISGMVIVMLPFLIYFYVNDGLQEMWYASFWHNIEYVEHSRFLSHRSSYAMGSFIFSYAIYFAAIIAGLLCTIFHLSSRRIAIALLLASIVTLAFISQTYARGTYSLSSISIFCLVVFLMDELVREKGPSCSKWFGWAMFTFAVIVFSMQAGQEMGRDYKSYDLTLYKQVENCIPTSEHHSFVGFDLKPDIYVYTALKPAHRFFIVYSVCLDADDSLVERIRKEYQRTKAKWVLVKQTGYKVCIQDVLDQNYDIYKSFIQGYTLYHLKQ